MVRKVLVLVLLVAVLALDLSSAVDYCKIASCDGQPHTACIYPSADGKSPCSGRIIHTGLSEDEKRRLVDIHNQLRQKVASGNERRGSPGPQPPAKHMPNLEWDDELACIAQKWADRCTWAHDKCRDVEKYQVGQNLASIATTGNVNDVQVEEMVQMWYDEVQYYSKHEVKKFRNRGAGGQVIGHYTQLVWAKSTKIGCGAVKYKDGKFNKFHLVCNYGPSGNYMGEPVYETP